MFLDLVKRNRSYRSYDESRPVSRAQLEELVELIRYAPSSVNMQPLKYVLAAGDDTVSRIQPLTGWAKRLKGITLPPEGHCPTGFVVICMDLEVSSNADRFMKDVGIVAQTMLLGAVEMGLGGCMIGSFGSPAALADLLSLEARYLPVLVVALGTPDEEILMEDLPLGGDICYYRDEQNRHHVPKRTAAELILNP